MTTPWVAAFTALAAVVLLLAVFVLGLAQRVLRTLNDLEVLRSGQSQAVGQFGLPIGSEAPPVLASEPNTTGEPAASRAQHPSVVLFVEGDCHPCHSLIADLVQQRARPPRSLAGYVIADEGLETEARSLEEGWTTLTDGHRSIADAWRVNATPLAYVVAADGRISGKGFPNSATDLNRIIDEADGHNHAFAQTEYNHPVSPHVERVNSS